MGIASVAYLFSESSPAPETPGRIGDEINIVSAIAYSTWDTHATASHAYDGDTSTYYASLYENPMNWVKFYLSEPYNIGVIKVVNRLNCCKDRFEGTIVSLYLSDALVTDCGIFTNVGTDNSNTDVDYNTYYISCNGAYGDMLNLTYTSDSSNTWLQFAEINVYQFHSKS